MKKNDKLIFFITFIELIRLLFISTPAFLWIRSNLNNTILFLYCIILFFYSLKKILEFFFFKYNFEKEKLIIHTGIIWKKTLTFSKGKNNIINSVNIKQNFLYKIIRRYNVIISLKDEDGKNIEFKCLRNKEKDIICLFLEKKEMTNIEIPYTRELIYRIKIKYVIIMAFFSFNYIAVIIFGKEMIQKLEILGLDNYFDAAFFKDNLIIIITILIVFISVVLIQVVKLNNFSVYHEKDFFIIESGLLHSKINKIEENNIHTLILKQNFIMKFFRITDIYSVLLKNGSEDAKQKILIFPYIKNDEISNIINSTFSEFKVCLRKAKTSIRLYIFRAFFIIIFFIIVGIYYYTSNLLSFLMIIPTLYYYYYYRSKLTTLIIKNNLTILNIPNLFSDIQVLIKKNGIELLRHTNINGFEKYKIILYTSTSPNKNYILRGVNKTKLIEIMKLIN